MSQGKCLVCHVLGPESRNRNFLCTNCVHPSEVRIYCARCRIIATADAAATQELAARLPTDLKPVPGMSIRMPFCARCRTSKEAQGRAPIEVYGIALN